MKTKIKTIITAAILCAFTQLPIRTFAQVANGTGAGNCLNFNASNDGVSYTNTIIPSGSNQLTISLWCYTQTAIGGAAAFLIAQPRIIGNEYFYIVRMIDGTIKFWVSPRGEVGGQDAWGTTTTAIDLTKFCNITCVWNGTNNMQIFIDGVSQPVNLGTYGGGISGSSFDYSGGKLDMQIGNYVPPTSSQVFLGQIDEVRIWNYALTETEIRATMCKKLKGNETGLVGYWRFDEGSGSTAYDASPNGNNGTLH